MRRGATMLIAIATMTLAASPALADKIAARGALSCGMWLSGRKLAGTQPSTLMGMSYVHGYLARASLSERRDYFKAADNESIKAWLDNYCAANPLVDLFTAATALTSELNPRAPSTRAPDQ